MPTFLEVLASNPALFQAVAAAALQASGVKLGNVQTNIATAAAVPTWTGVAKDAFQQQKTATLLDLLGKVIGGVGQTQTAVTAGGAQMQASKAQMDAAVMLATAEGFKVLPNGGVILGPRLRAAASARPEIKPALYARAAQHAAVIHAAHAQTTAADSQLALTIAKVAVEVIGGMLNKSGTAAVPTTSLPLPPTTSLPALPPSTVQPLPGTAPVTAFTPSGFDPATAGTALAGVSPLDGAAGFGGPSALGGATSLSPLSAGSALSGGIGGAGPAQLVPGAAGVAGGRGASATPGPMMGGGMGAAAHSDEGVHDRADWLVEDGDPWGAGDAPDGVIGGR